MTTTMLANPVSRQSFCGRPNRRLREFHHFMRLPSELRDQVYQRYFCGNKPKTTHPLLNISRYSERRLLALLQTCSAIRKECLQHLWRISIVKLDIYGWQYLSVAKSIAQWNHWQIATPGASLLCVKVASRPHTKVLLPLPAHRTSVHPHIITPSPASKMDIFPDCHPSVDMGSQPIVLSWL